MKKQPLTASERAEFIKVLDGFMELAGSTFASATYIKADGSVRRLTFNPRMARKGTATRNALTKGGKMAYDPNDFGLLPVVDIFKYRRGEDRVWSSVDFRTLMSLKARGQELVPQ